MRGDLWWERSEEYAYAIREYLPLDKQQALLDRLAAEPVSEELAHAILDQLLGETELCLSDFERCAQFPPYRRRFPKSCAKQLKAFDDLYSWIMMQRFDIEHEHFTEEHLSEPRRKHRLGNERQLEARRSQIKPRPGRRMLHMPEFISDWGDYSKYHYLENSKSLSREKLALIIDKLMPHQQTRFRTRMEANDFSDDFRSDLIIAMFSEIQRTAILESLFE